MSPGVSRVHIFKCRFAGLVGLAGEKEAANPIAQNKTMATRSCILEFYGERLRDREVLQCARMADSLCRSEIEPTDSQNPPNDSRSFEERIAGLKKPDVVDQPDEEKVQSRLASINEKITACDKRLVRTLVCVCIGIIPL